MNVFKKIVASIMLGTTLAAATYAVPADTFLAEQTSLSVEAASNLSTPKIQSAIYQGNGKVLLSWGKVSKASGYKVCYSTDGGKNYQALSSTTKTTMTINVTEGKTYNFSVRAYRTANGSTEYSNWSDDAVCKAVITKPEDVPCVVVWSLENEAVLLSRGVSL